MFTKKNLAFLSFVLFIVCSPNHSFAQTRSKKSTNQRSSSSSLSQSAIALSNARLDACMQKNRILNDDMFELNAKLSEANTQLSAVKNNTSYFQNMLARSRDSLRTAQVQFRKVEDETKAQLTVMGDSLAILRDFRDKVMIEKQAVANDPNVVRVYDFPADIVRIKMLRKFLDEGTGITLEKNTDDGFSISKLYKDRIKKSGLTKKTLESKVECAIKMAPHPFNGDRTMFYVETLVQERTGKKTFEDIADKKLVKDYEQKVLKFFDTFLTK